MSIEKKIAVLSTGANGSCIAADLTLAGLNVSMIDQWADHIESMRKGELRIITDEDEYKVGVKAYHISDICSLNQKFDIVFLTSKAYDSRWLTEFINPYLDDNGILVAVQNCMTAEMIGEIVGLDRTLGCVVELASQLFEPGQVKRSTPKDRTWFGLGAFDEAHQHRVVEITEVLKFAGNVEVIPDIISAKWMKLIVNSMTMAIKAILGMTNEQVFYSNGKDYAARVRDLFLRSGEEALAAGQLVGHKVVPIFGLKSGDVENTNNLLETLLDKIVNDVGPTAINTVLQDHMKGRYSEIDMINGLVSTESKKHGKNTPVTDIIVDLTHQIHSGDLKPNKQNLELINRRLLSPG